MRKRQYYYFNTLLLCLCHLHSHWGFAVVAEEEQQDKKDTSSSSSSLLTCSISGHEQQQRDPALQEMHYTLAGKDGEQQKTFWAYVEPNVASFYTQQPQNNNETSTTSMQKQVPMNTGLAVKFINLSDKTLYLYWSPNKNGDNPVLNAILYPFSTSGTASYIGHYFFLTTTQLPPQSKNIVDPRTIVQWIQISNIDPSSHLLQNIYTYDPYHVQHDPQATEANLAHLSPENRALYNQWKDTLQFHEQYQNFTGRAYLGNYPPRPPPIHHMWRADHYGDVHWVTTKETHFTKLPPRQKLRRIIDQGTSRILQPQDPRLLSQYRTPNETMMNMTLKVLSCAPRVFEIDNFLSEVEVNHILELVGGEPLTRSAVGVYHRSESSTRTSKNSWIDRDKSPIIDAIHRRAADLLRIDESLLRSRASGERDDFPTKRTIAEPLQLVHYTPGQEYASHHDFGIPPLNSNQEARFATLLLYLNEGMVGGKTIFPRWANAETTGRLEVVPKKGKAILFYSQLPDGNFDDLSQHAAMPVIEGEKWLINLWIWEPTHKRNDIDEFVTYVETTLGFNYAGHMEDVLKKMHNICQMFPVCDSLVESAINFANL